MKNWLIKLLALVGATALCLGFASCSKDDDDNSNNNDLVGIWVCTHSQAYSTDEYGNTLTVYLDWNPNDIKSEEDFKKLLKNGNFQQLEADETIEGAVVQVYEYTSDGKLCSYILYDIYDNIGGVKTPTVDWALKNNKLTISAYGESQSVDVIELSSTNVSWKGDIFSYGESDHIEKVTLTKISASHPIYKFIHSNQDIFEAAWDYED